MVIMHEENIDYLKRLQVNEEDIEIIMDNIIFKEERIFDFRENIFNNDVQDYELFEIIYHKKSKQFVNVYIENSEEYDAFEFQAYNIPGRKFTDVGICIMISRKFYDTDKTLFYAVLGHELAHIDFSNLVKFNDHSFQNRYSILEAYCDIKGVEMFCNKEDVKKSLQIIIESICPPEQITNKSISREIEIRKMLLRLYLKGKINSEIIAVYINNNYLKHMLFIEHNDDRYYELYSKFNDTSKWSKDARRRLMYYKDYTVNKYFI